MKRIFSSLLLGTALVGAGLTATAQVRDLTPPPPAAVPADATQFSFKLKGYVFGLRMIKSNYSGAFNDDAYSVRADIKTSGLGALLKKMAIWAVTTGRFDNGNLLPASHTQQNLDKKNRRVEMRYDYGQRTVDIDINPPNGSFGTPPATPAEQFTSDDTLSAILNMMLRGYKSEGEVCTGGVKVFDSKQHYNLRMERAEETILKQDGFKGAALKCHVYYEAISGFDPEDLPETEESSTPVVVYFVDRPDLGMHIPMRFTYKISGFKAVIKIVDMQVTPPTGIIHGG